MPKSKHFVPNQPPNEVFLPDWAALSVRKFCQYLCLSRSSYYRAAAAGLIHPVKCNGRTLIPVAEAKAFLDRLQGKGGDL